MKKLLALSFLIALTLVPARAVITDIGPFTGALSENWESFSFGAFTGPTPIMGGAATLSPAGPGTDGVSPTLSSQALTHFAGLGPVGISFTTPVTEFGANWAGAGTVNLTGKGFVPTVGPTTVTFFDVNNQVIGSSTFTPSAQGGWAGWSSDVGIKSLSFDYGANAPLTGASANTSGLFVDDLQANLQTVPVPEASTWLVGGLLIGAVGFRTLREVRARKTLITA